MAYLIIRIEPKENEQRSEKDCLPVIAKLARGGFATGTPIAFDTMQELALRHGYQLRLGYDNKAWPFIAYAYTSPNREGVGRAGMPLRRYPARERARA